MEKFTGEIDTPQVPLLFDYSYAGYQLGAEGIPKDFKNFTIFNVLDF